METGALTNSATAPGGGDDGTGTAREAKPRYRDVAILDSSVGPKEEGGAGREYFSAMPDEERSDGPLPALRRRLGRGLGHSWSLLTKAIGGLSEDHGTQLAASMAYYALFSIFPAAIVVAAGAGLILDDSGAREDAIQYLTRELPLSETNGRSDIEQVLDGVTSNYGTLGLIGLVALLITASALISAARNSLNVIFGEQTTRGLIRGKALDLLLVLGLGVLFVSSFAVTVASQFHANLSGALGDFIQSVIDTGGSLLPLALTLIVFTVAFKVLPAERRPLRDLWPGILIASLGYELVKRGFSIYLESFSNYSAVYGSLGAVIAFMFFVYLASLVFLFAAEVASFWPGVRDGDYDPDPDDEGTPFSEELKGFLRRLVSRNEKDG